MAPTGPLHRYTFLLDTAVIPTGGMAGGKKSAMRRSWADDAALTDVVGSIVMLAITIVVFAGVSIVVVAEVAGTDEEAPPTFRFEEIGDHVVVRHMGGIPVPLSQIQALITDAGSTTTVALGDHAASIGNGDDRWDIGESICIIGTGCIDADADSASIVLRGSIVAMHGGGT